MKTWIPGPGSPAVLDLKNIKKVSTTIFYKGYRIFTHPYNYGRGERFMFERLTGCGDDPGQCGDAGTVEECKNQIDEILEEENENNLK